MGINKKDLIQRVAAQVGQDNQTVEAILDATLEEIYQSLKQFESVTLQNFGTFYIRGGRERSVFKFTPSQRLKKLFGWSSTYKGEV